MATYITTVHFTVQGLKEIDETVNRSIAFKVAAEKMGVDVKNIYWTLGPFDGLMVCEAPDEETVTALMMHLGAAGNVTTQTCRAYGADEIESVISKLKS